MRKGNEYYKQKNFDASAQEYNKALTADSKNTTAHYNIGNAQFRNNKLDEAIASYDNSISNSDNRPIREKAFYNKGVAFSKQKKLNESIDAWKESLKLDPNDMDARENLQKALMELKKQQDQQNKENKDQQNKKQDQKQQQQKQQQPQSKLSKQQVEQLLKALQQKEKEIQQKLQRADASPNKPEKDW